MVTEPFAGRYERLRLLGRGGFGAVYRAWDPQMEREVAIKLLNADLAANEDWRRRFRQEATAASRLSHPNITVVFDRGETDGQPFIVMELVRGEPLSHVIERQAPLQDAERVFLLEQLCDGLHYAHQRQIVHRDVKPVNLVVHEDDEDGHAARTLKILDFGIAKVMDAGLTMTGGTLMFSPSYVSPEQVMGKEVDRRSDLFAVGAVAYELLTYTKAFPIVSTSPIGFFDELKRKIVDELHPSMRRVRPELDVELCEIVDRALSKTPDARFRDLAEMRRRLHDVRKRLEDVEPDARERTRIVIHPAIGAALAAARAALAANDPAAVREAIEPVMAIAPEGLVKRELEQLLEESSAGDSNTASRDGVIVEPSLTPTADLPFEDLNPSAPPPERESNPPRASVDETEEREAFDGHATSEDGWPGWLKWVAVAVGIVLVFGVAGVLWQRPAKTSTVTTAIPAPSAPPQSGRISTSQKGPSATSEEATPSTPVTSSIPGPAATGVTFDAHPWARVRVRAVDVSVDPTVQSGETPVVFLLLPGEYVVDVFYEGRGPAVTERLSVGNEPAKRDFTKQGYDPARAASELLGSSR